MLNLLQTWLAKIPHLLYFLGVAFVGGLASYLAEVPASSLLTAFSTQEGATALLKGALIAGLLAVISVLKPATKGEIKSVYEVRAAAKAAAFLCLLVFLGATQSACLSGVPIVPVTPQNQAQVSGCQSTAGLHNALVFGDMAFSGGVTTLGAIGAIDTNSNTRAWLAGSAAVVGGLAAVDAAWTAVTSAQFANGNCPSVVGSLPATAGGAK